MFVYERRRQVKEPSLRKAKFRNVLGNLEEASTKPRGFDRLRKHIKKQRKLRKKTADVPIAAED